MKIPFRKFLLPAGLILTVWSNPSEGTLAGSNESRQVDRLPVHAGYRYSRSFGLFWQTASGWAWFYRPGEWAWMYGGDLDNLFLYRLDSGWAWTNVNYYPWIYQFGTGWAQHYPLQEGHQYLEPIRMKLASILAKSGHAPVNILCMGDSWTHAPNGYIGALAARLQADYGNAGAGWCGFGGTDFGTSRLFNGSWDTNAVSYSLEGSWTYTPFGGRGPDLSSVSTTTVGDRIAVTVGKPHDQAVLYCYNTPGGGSFRYQVGTGPWTEVSTDAAAGNRFIDLPDLPSITPYPITIEIVSPGTNGVVIEGLDLQINQPGVRIHKLGASGSAGADWFNALFSRRIIRDTWAHLQPDLVTILLGTNDQARSTDQSAYQRQLTTVITHLRAVIPDCAILLVIPSENGGGRTIPMSDFRDTAKQVATDKQCAFLDLVEAFGDHPNYTYQTSLNFFQSDQIHPNAEGRQFISDLLCHFVTGQP